MTLQLPPSSAQPAARYFDLELHPTIDSDGGHASSARAIKAGRVVVVSFLLYSFVDRESVIGFEPIIYLPDELAPLGIDAGDAPASSGPYSLCRALSVLGGNYPRHWAMGFRPWHYPVDGDYPSGIYDTPAFAEERFSIADGEERVECAGGMTYIAA